MSIKKYRIFAKTAEVGNITKAASGLGYTQSAISHTINAMEEDWGLLLFERGKNGVSLTEAGRQLLQPVTELLYWEEQLKKKIVSIRKIAQGTLRIGAFASVSVGWLPHIFRQTKADYPDINLQMFTGEYEEIEHWIATEHVDYGFVIRPSSKGEYQWFPLMPDRLMVVFPHGHPLTRHEKITLEQIQDEPFIMPSPGVAVAFSLISDPLIASINVKHVIKDVNALLAMVENGHGISIQSEMFLKTFSSSVHARELDAQYDRVIGLAVSPYRKEAAFDSLFLQVVKGWVNDHYIARNVVTA